MAVSAGRSPYPPRHVGLGNRWGGQQFTGRPPLVEHGRGTEPRPPLLQGNGGVPVSSSPRGRAATGGPRPGGLPQPCLCRAAPPGYGSSGLPWHRGTLRCAAPALSVSLPRSVSAPAQGGVPRLSFTSGTPPFREGRGAATPAEWIHRPLSRCSTPRVSAGNPPEEN